jgi:oligopeptide transport system substrate-binding protein
MFINNELDWATNVPNDNIGQASMRDDFNNSAQLATYYYDFNNEVAPFNNPLVRKAFSLALDREALVEGVTKGGQIPAYGMVPSMAGYEALEAPFDNIDDSVAEAQKLMAEAGYPDGVGLGTITILYNTNDGHKAVAEFVQQELKDKLGVDIELENEEWSTFLTDRNNGKFQLARDGWVGDYQDPNTFLDMFISGAAMNGCQYASEQYDTLINGAARMPAGESRMGVLKTADDLISQQDNAIMPLYYYVSNNRIDTNKWGGCHTNTMDVHPVKDIYLK